MFSVLVVQNKPVNHAACLFPLDDGQQQTCTYLPLCQATAKELRKLHKDIYLFLQFILTLLTFNNPERANRLCFCQGAAWPGAVGLWQAGTH